MQTPEMPQIVLRPIESLVAYARNARTHSPAQLEKLQASLREFGWTNPVLADAMGIVAGHGRTMAAAEMYKRGEAIRFPNGAPIPLGMVPVVDCTGWSDQQRKAYILTDNRSALDAGWDEELLRLELADLRDDGYDLSLTGFEDVELAALFEGVVEPEDNDRDPEACPDVPDEPASRLGDVWVIGGHRVMCGSSLEAADWDKLMMHDYADCVFTDPPYGVSIGDKNDSMAKAQGRTNKTGGILNDDLQGDALYKFLLQMFECVRERMKPGAPIYVYHADTEGLAFRSSFRDAGFKLQSVLQWKKNTFVLSRWDMHPIAEPCLYGWKPGAGHKWYGGRKQSTFFDLGDASPFQQLEDGRWQVVVGDAAFIVSGEAKVELAPSTVFNEPKPAKSELHPTMKPVSLVMRHLRNSARQGDLVVDAFGGSGSTAVASHKLGMKSCLMELDPKYVDVICRRMWDFTGVRPVHAVTGEPFPADGEVRSVAPAVEAEAESLDVF